MKTPPGVIVLGAAKSGTTWLHWASTQHPDLVTPSMKETNFFSLEFFRGEDWYEGLFEGRGQGTRIDNSPSYLIDASATRRILEHAPEARFVVVLRNTLDRALSNYDMMHNNRLLTHVKRDLAYGSRVIQGSLYGTHLRRWVDAVGADRISVLLYDQLKADPAGFWAAYCDAVGVETFVLPKRERVNARRGRPRHLGLYGRVVDVAKHPAVYPVLTSPKLARVRSTFHSMVFAQDSAARADIPAWHLRRLVDLFDHDLDRLPKELGLSEDAITSLRPAASSAYPSA